MDVTTTRDEDSLFTYTVPGGTLGTKGCVRASMNGTYLANVTMAVFTLRVYYGGVQYYGGGAAAMAVSATRGAFWIDLLLSERRV